MRGAVDAARDFASFCGQESDLLLAFLVHARLFRQHERQFRGFNGLQLAFDALQRKLSDAASPAGQEEEVPSEAAADSEKKTLPSAAEEADAQALRRAAELLSPELHELSESTKSKAGGSESRGN